MPNHVANSLLVHGDPSEVARFISVSTRGYTVLPGDPVKAKERANVLAPSRIEADGEFSFGALTGVPADYADNWYAAGHDLWGTKWDAYGCAVNAEAATRDNLAAAVVTIDGRASLSFVFQTAWSPPLPWLTAASEMFPTLTFRMEFIDEMPNYMGFRVARDGVLTGADYESTGEYEALAGSPYPAAPDSDDDEARFAWYEDVDEWLAKVRHGMEVAADGFEAALLGGDL